MVKSIINVRRLPSICWWRELITDVRKPEIMIAVLDVIVGGELLLITPITLRLSHEEALARSMTPDATSFFPVGGMPTASSLFLKDFSEKSGRCGITQQIKERWRFTMIDRGDINQAIDR